MNKFKTIFLIALMFLAVAMNESICFADYLSETDIKRVSVVSDGSQADGESSHHDFPSISVNGRYISFASRATNLVPDDTNKTQDIFIHDQETGQTTRVNISTDGVQANGYSHNPSVSADGRYIAFSSYATNLVPDDTNGASDVFVYDQETRETMRVSVDSNNVQANEDSYYSFISADGRYISFGSYATNLVSNDTNNKRDVFVHDRETEQTIRVSVSSDGIQSNRNSGESSISADGCYISFGSHATNLVAGDTNGEYDIFVHDRETGQTTRVSVSADGVQANENSGCSSISADGRYISFDSYATNLVSDDTNNTSDIFIYDRETGQITRASVSTDSVQANESSYCSSISADGSHIVFSSGATNLVSDDTNGEYDIFVHSRETGETTRVSVSTDSVQANEDSDYPSISVDGRYIAFASDATNLVPDDTNGVWDIFVVGDQNDWGGGEPEPDFLPSVDGFKQKNFSITYFDEELNQDVGATWEMFEQFFGTDATMIGGSRQYIAEEFFRTEYGRIRGGYCDGFSSASLLNFKHLDQPNSGSFAMPYYEKLYDVQNFSDEMRDAVAYQHGFFDSLKISSYIMDSTEEANNSPRFFYERIKKSIQDKEPLTLCLWEEEEPEWWEKWKKKIDSGHALTPYRYEEDISENKAYVFVYDSNYPKDDDRKVTFDFSDDSWSFEFEKGWWVLGETWTGSINDTPRITIGTIPLSMRLDKGIAPWWQEISPFAYVCSVGETISPLFSNQDGDQIGFTEDGFINEIAGANYFVPPTQTQDQTPGSFYLPEDNDYSITLHGNEEGTTDFRLFGNRLLIEIADAMVHPSTVDNITVGRGEKSFTYSTNDDYKEYSATIAEELSEASRIVTVDTNISAGDLTTLEITDKQSFKYTNAGGTKSYNLFLEQRGASIDYASFTGLTIEANETHVVNVEEWDDLEDTVIDIEIDYDSDGVVDEIQRLQFIPKQLKAEVKESLESAKTGNNRIDKKINGVIKDINKSLQDDLWQDKTYLDSKKGRRVFTYEMAAVTKMKLYLYLSEHSNYHKLPDNVVFAFEQAMKDLVAVDKILAEVILDDAKNTPVNNPNYQARFDRMIAEAERNMKQADQYSANNNPARAILKYGFSWYYSQKAIKIAGR